MNKLLRCLFCVPTAQEYAERELKTAQLEKLKAESLAEYALSQADRFSRTINRLETFLNETKPHEYE